ncbi:MAG: hypothetical protein ACKPH3_11045 [Dolichospermum sp.]
MRPSTRLVVLGKKLWTPAQISTDLWLDAADSSTITLNGSTVSQWNDKSGNGRNATQATAANQPAYNETQNGLRVVTFDGTNDTLNTVAFTFPTTNLASCCVFRTTSITAKGVWGGGETFPNRLGLFFTGSSQLRSMQNDSGIDIGGYSTNVYVLVSSSRIGADVSQFRDGTQVANATMIAENAASFALSIGSWANNVVPSLAGQFAELVIFNSNTTTRQLIEGYLAWKWGLVANLLLSHPFKFNPPLA